jgi:hypothetical protein
MCNAAIVVLSRLAIPAQEDPQLTPPPDSPGSRTGRWTGCHVPRRFPDAARRVERSTSGVRAICHGDNVRLNYRDGHCLGYACSGGHATAHIVSGQSRNADWRRARDAESGRAPGVSGRSYTIYRYAIQWGERDRELACVCSRGLRSRIWRPSSPIATIDESALFLSLLGGPESARWKHRSRTDSQLCHDGALWDAVW